MPKRSDIKKVLVIGSGPIVIGQAAEFDYAGAQACRVMKSEGVKNGVFDITICYGNGKVAFLEIKTKKGKPSEHQLLWLEWFKNNGYLAKICYGYDECIDFIDNL